MKTVQWDPSTIFLSDINTDLENYERGTARTGKAFSNGQVKLEIADMLFLINHTANENGVRLDNIKLVVAGSVTGEHHAVDLHLFPFIAKIDFWDPKPDLSLLREGKPPATLPHQKIEFFTNTLDIPDGGYLTPERAREMYANEKNVFFISDLRTVGPKEYEDQWRRNNGLSTLSLLTRNQADRFLVDTRLHASESQQADIRTQFQDTEVRGYLVDLSIEQKLALDAEYNYKLNNDESQELDVNYEMELWTKDSELQMQILKEMNPVQAMLKFRLPYYHEKIAIYLGDEIEYLDGYIYKQAFTGPHSTETRLVPIKDQKTGEWKTRSYNLRDYERKMFYHNTVLRDDAGGEKIWLNSINRSSSVPDLDEGLINSYDTCYLLYVIDRYLEFTGEASPIADERFTQAIAIWYWIRDTINTYLYKPMNMKAARETVLANARKRGLTVGLGSTVVKEQRPSLSSKEILQRRKQEAASSVRSFQGIRTAPQRVLSPITIAQLESIMPTEKDGK